MFKHRLNHHHRDLRCARHTRDAIKRQQAFRLLVRTEKNERNAAGFKETKTT